MMTIKQHLELEKSSLKPNKNKIEELTKILKRNTLTIEQWRMTGRFIPAEEFIQNNPNTKIEKECREVIEYAGKSFIQVLSKSDFVFKDTKRKTLDEVEDIMWIKISESLWCENC
jgi:GTP-binding protein EngB required for normal cell division